MKFNVLTHSAIVLDDSIYVDPYKLPRGCQKATYIFITHPHHDHYSPADIKKIATEKTTIVVTQDVANQIKKDGLPHDKIVIVEPNMTYIAGEIKFATFASYNLGKQFHPQQNNWVGYNIERGGKRYAILGDSDNTPDVQKIKCDVLFVPIGGTYTMTAGEATELTNTIKPSVVVPTHYNCLIGSKADEAEFVRGINKDIKIKILI